MYNENMNNTFESEKYYSVAEICELDPVCNRRGKFWLLNKIRDNQLPVTNTAMGMKRPSYLVKGENIIEFLQTL